MPALQEVLVSYGIEVDEAALGRLNDALSDDREIASALAAAFDAADSAARRFNETLGLLNQADLNSLRLSPALFSSLPAEETANSLTNQATRTLTPTLDTEQISARLSAALEEVSQKPVKLTADADSFLSKVRVALARVRAAVSAARMTLEVGVSVNTEGSGKGLLTWNLKQLALGARVDRPTIAHLAEDGNPEYVIPVRREDQAVPLIRRMLSELSGTALKDLTSSLGISPGSGSSAADAVSAALTGPGVTVNNTWNVQAPVSISVKSDGADPDRVARGVYNAAEARLVRTLRNTLG